MKILKRLKAIFQEERIVCRECGSFMARRFYHSSPEYFCACGASKSHHDIRFESEWSRLNGKPYPKKEAR